MSTPANLKIDFVSDIVCPWCAIGLAALDKALANIGTELTAELHFHPFELNPDMGPQGQNIVEHLAGKYGSTPEQFAQSQANIRARGAAVGFTFNMDEHYRTYNTFDAHRLLFWAGTAGHQHELQQALFSAYFTEGRNPGDREVLLDVAAHVGLNVDKAREVLDSNRYAPEVRQQEEMNARMGIRAVPAVIVNDKYLISGGQPVDVFEQALRKIAAEAPAAAK